MPTHPRDRDNAVLERLAKRLEDRAGKLRQLVEQEDASVCERDLTGTRAWTASYDRGRRRAVVRRPKRRHDDERPLGRQEPADRMDPRHLERLLPFERGQDSGEPSREHGLARPRRAHQKKVVTSGGSNLESSASPLLATDVGEVGDRRGIERVRDQWSEPGNLDLAAKVGDDLREMAHRNGLDPGESHLGSRLGGAENALEPGSVRSLCDRQRPGDRAYATVERELAHRRVLGEPLGRDLACCGED